MKHPIDDEILVELINRFPQGASLEEVMIGIDPHIPRRTLQRRLANLVKKEEIVALGKGRARRYQSKRAVLFSPKTAELSLSVAGKRIQLQISQPIQSCALYTATRATIGEPDIFRFEYRSAIQNAIQTIVRQLINKKHAPALLRQIAERMPEGDRSRFIELVERELQGLHEGNIARYQLRLEEYEHWKAVWIKKEK